MASATIETRLVCLSVLYGMPPYLYLIYVNGQWLVLMTVSILVGVALFKSHATYI